MGGRRSGMTGAGGGHPVGHTDREETEDMSTDKRSDERPDTAAGEVLAEIEDAETHGEGTGRPRRSHGHGSGEAGDAITPNQQAQEEADGEGA